VKNLALSSLDSVRRPTGAEVLAAKARVQRQLLLERIAQGNQMRIARAPLMLFEAAELAELLGECAAALAEVAA
jgi:hypothetical protein